MFGSSDIFSPWSCHYFPRFATHPQGLSSGCLAFVRPPFGWSTGFFATPRTASNFVVCVEKLHFPSTTLCRYKFFIVAKTHSVVDGRIFTSVDGNEIYVNFTFFAVFLLVALVPEHRAYVARWLLRLNTWLKTALRGKYSSVTIWLINDRTAKSNAVG